MNPAPPPDLFDRQRRALVRDRAARGGVELFLYERAFAECLDRIGDIKRRFERALLIGVPDPGWITRLESVADSVESIDPGAFFATTAGGIHADEDRHDLGIARFDLIVAIGTLDTVNDLGAALLSIRQALSPDSVLIGVLAGGDSLPALRRAMLSADQLTGPAAARTHPRIAPATLAGLLSAARFVMPVVDVDRVTLSYDGLAPLIRDLRKMGASNVLIERAPPRGRRWADFATAAFAAAAVEGRTEERIDLIYFHGWSAGG